MSESVSVNFSGVVRRRLEKKQNSHNNNSLGEYHEQ